MAVLKNKGRMAAALEVKGFLSHFGLSHHILQYENYLRRPQMSRKNCSSDCSCGGGCGCGGCGGCGNGCGCGCGGFGGGCGGSCTGCFGCCDYSCVLSSIYNVYTLQYLASILYAFLGCGFQGGGCCGGPVSPCGGYGGCGGNCGCSVTTTC